MGSSVFDDPSSYAFALPAQNCVYTGLLDVAVNQHQVAAVIGHEVRAMLLPIM